MSKAIFSILSILALLLSGINCATGRSGGGGGDASSSTPNRAKVLEIVIEVLRAAEYEIKSKDENEGHVSAAKGNARITLTVSKQRNSCHVKWMLVRDPPPNPGIGSYTDKESVIVSCDGFLPKLKRALGID